MYICNSIANTSHFFDKKAKIIEKDIESDRGSQSLANYNFFQRVKMRKPMKYRTLGSADPQIRSSSCSYLERLFDRLYDTVTVSLTKMDFDTVESDLDLS